MKKSLLLLLVLGWVLGSQAQFGSEPADTSWKNRYRETSAQLQDLLHTRLDIRFDYDKSYAYGQAWLTLKPHFYATDTLQLDAKGMDIKAVALMKGSTKTPLPFQYDGHFLSIKLNKTYTRNEQYVVYIDYVAKPNEFQSEGSAAITDAKGLYFINPKGEEPGKPTQIWTQGETEATSVWCPTIDKPNQKCTQEFNLTVPAKYVTLSNGKLTTQKKNSDGTRTDTWKMDLPNSPYLFFIGVGDYAVIKDNYKGKEVSYYVEQEYAPVARKIFGHTPEMMAFFSRITGVDYPWVKYAQIVGRDYVSGAMENTTATLHQESAQQDARELVDGNGWESTIAHELFHHWFGDYVTSESWSNLTLNESFANYSETLWDEYKYGKDAGDAQNYNDMQGYLGSNSDKKDLVRFYYRDKEDMFDAVSYNKGGRILHMLRNYVGDSAFFQSLNLYLSTNKFKSAEAQQLRLAFEAVTGRDLNWFWNQWYFGSGHPKLSIDYSYNDAAGKVQVIVKQTQSDNKVFRLPVAIDIYNGAKKQRQQVWVENRTDTFTFSYSTHPDLVNFDGDKILLAEKRENKTLDNYIHQYRYAGTYLDRREAVEFALRQQEDPKAWELIKLALADKFHGIRGLAVNRLDLKKASVKQAAEPILATMAAKDTRPLVRAAAIEKLSQYNNPAYKPLLQKALSDSSYSIAGAALEALQENDPAAAFDQAKSFSKKPNKGRLKAAIMKVLIENGTEADFATVASAYEEMPLSQEKFELTQPFCMLIAKAIKTANVKRGVDIVTKFRDGIPEQYGIWPVINNMLKGVISKKSAAMGTATDPDKIALQEQIDYIRKAIGEQTKGF